MSTYYELPEIEMEELNKMGLRDITEEEWNEIEAHGKWLDSNGMEGHRANFEDHDFRRANMAGMDLRGANVKGAKFEGANLNQVEF